MGLLAPAEQHVYSLFIEERLHSSGVLCPNVCVEKPKYAFSHLCFRHSKLAKK